MPNCCGKKMEALCDQLECKVTETKTGIQVAVTPKDPSKTESLKSLIKGFNDFCGCL